MNNIDNQYKEIILIDKEYYESLISDINRAEFSIDMETYIFALDKIGKDIASVLMLAAARKVKVRLLVDGVGTQDWKNDLFNRMKSVGIEIKVYHPLIWSVLGWPFKESFKHLIHYITHINSRNHRKTCVIDNKIAYVGSANIIEHAYATEKWHDITVKLTGVELGELQFAFNKAWKCLNFKSRFFIKYSEVTQQKIFRLNNSGRKRRKLYKALLKYIDNCQEHVWITNAYFVPRKFLLMKLIKVAKRGIDVRIIVPQKSDVWGMSAMMYSFFKVLSQYGVKIYSYPIGVLHTKLLILDDWFCVGSSNLNHRSLNHDLEVDVIIQTNEAKKELANKFIEYCNDSDKINLIDINNKPILEKIFSKFIWIFRFWF